MRFLFAFLLGVITTTSGIALLNRQFPFAFWRETAREAIKNKSLTAKSAVEEGDTLYEQQKVRESLFYYRLGISLDPSYALAYYKLGSRLAEMERYDDAIDAYVEALRLRPNYTEAYYNLGLAHVSEREFDKAIDALKHAVLIDDEFLPAHKALVEAYSKTGKLELARAERQRTALLYLGRGDSNSARALIRQWDDISVARSRSLVRTAGNYSELGKALAESNLYEAAIEQYKQAINLNSNYTDAYYNLGIAFLHLGQFDQAADALRKVKALDPTSAAARRQLAEAYIGLGKTQLADEELYESGILYLRQGMREQAATAWLSMKNTSRTASMIPVLLQPTQPFLSQRESKETNEDVRNARESLPGNR